MLNDSNVTSAANVLQKAIACEATSSAAHEMQCNSVGRGQSSQSGGGGQYGYKPGKRKYQPKNGKSDNSSGGTTVKNCLKCTWRGHVQQDCRTKCRVRKKVDHIAKFCREKGHAAK